jgi:hypothetical protein
MKINWYKLAVVAAVIITFVVLAICQGCQVQKLRKENAEYRAQNEQFKANNAELSARIDSLKNICADLQNQNTIFEENNGLLLQNINDLKIENANFIVENRKLKQYIDGLDDISKAFADYLNRLKNEVSRLEKIGR